MRPTYFWLALVVFSGCGGSSLATTTTPVVEACPNPLEVRLGSVCADMSGSRWHVKASAPGGEYEFDVELLVGGRLRVTDHPGASLATDDWQVESNALRWYFSNRYVEYRASMNNGTVIVGEAQNLRGDSWPFRADRLTSPAECLPSELRVAEACFSLVGMQYAQADGSVLRFLHDGQVEVVGAPGAAAASNIGRWRQEGANVSIGEAQGTLTPPFDALVVGSLTLTRVPLFGSNMHK